MISSTAWSRNEKNFADRLTSLERAMRLCDVAQRHLAIDADFQFTGGDHLEDVVRAPEQLLARRGVMAEGRASEIYAVFGEASGVDRRDRPTRLSEEREHSAQA